MVYTQQVFVAWMKKAERQIVFSFYKWRNRDEVTCAELQNDQEPGNLNLRIDSQHSFLVATSDSFI